MKPETQEWIDKAEGDSLAIHIALLPDKSGFKTGARILEILTSYRHIAPSEREAKSLNFNDNPMDFQQLVLYQISFAIIVYVEVTQLNAQIPVVRRFIAAPHGHQRPINRATTVA